MKPRTVAALALVVAALAAFVFFYERDLPSPEERRAAGDRVIDLAEAEVDWVVLEWQGGRVRLEQDSGEDGDGGGGESGASRWRLVEPVDARADASGVRALVAELTGLERTRTLSGEDAGDLAGQGFEPPRGRVVVGAGDREVALEVGARVPLTGSLLVRPPGSSEVWVVDGSLLDSLERPPDDWRDRRVLPVPADRIGRIAIATAGAGRARREAIVLERRAGLFRLVAPVDDLADAGRVEELLAELGSLRAERFLPTEAAADRGLASPEATFELAPEGRPDDEAPLVLEIGAPAADGFTRRVRLRGGETGTAGETIIAPASALLELAALEPEAWRSREWTPLESYEVAALEATSAGGTHRLVRDGADWRLDGAVVPFTEVSDLLLALTSATVEDFLPPADDGEPLLTLTLRREGGEPETLTVHPPRTADAAQIHPARSSTRPGTVLALPAAVVDEVAEALEAVRAAGGPTDEP